MGDGRLGWEDELALQGLARTDRTLLRKHLSALLELAAGARVPETDAQRQFVDVCRGVRGASTDYERAFVRFLESRAYVLSKGRAAHSVAALARAALPGPRFPVRSARRSPRRRRGSSAAGER